MDGFRKPNLPGRNTQNSAVPKSVQARLALVQPPSLSLPCSQGGAKFPTGGMGPDPEPASAPDTGSGVSRSGARPGPTVKVRMEENVRTGPARGRTLVIALGDVSLSKRRSPMTHTRYAFIKANWHKEIVDQALAGFQSVIPADQIDVFDVPGAFELPLLARDLARSGRYLAIAAAAFVVDGGIYRHDFVAQAVIDGLMRAGLDTGVPVLSVSLTPHQYQDTSHHNAIYRAHFVQKGREAAEAALMIGRTRSRIAA